MGLNDPVAGKSAATTHGSPYRRPRPKRSEILAKGNFHWANEHGSYALHALPMKLALCREYLWVDDNLSIPLDTIRDVGLTKHGGVIVFWDAVSGTERRLDFTKVGFLRFRRRVVEAFLRELTELLSTRERSADAIEPHHRTPKREAAPGVNCCEVCAATECGVYVFYTFKFVGFVLLAFAYDLKPWRYVLCADHARRQMWRCCVYSAVWGSLGFPGFVAAPYYVGRNLWTLARGGAADAPTILVCFLACAVLPLSLISAGIWWLVRWMG